MIADMPPAEELIERAIAKKVCISGIYNRNAVTLAPNSLFERHGDLFLRAVTVEVEGRKPRELKIGTFKLAGLTEVALTRRLFSARTLFAGLDAPAGAAGDPT